MARSRTETKELIKILGDRRDECMRDNYHLSQCAVPQAIQAIEARESIQEEIDSLNFIIHRLWFELEDMED
jgi:hypothetical protein